jgi:hypothetical protein
MDPRERIALWVALIVLLVFVLVRSSSSFVGAQMSFVDLAEFDTLPSDMKKMYYDTMVNGVAKEAGQKVSEMWAALTPAQKEEAKAQAAKQAKMVVEQIKSGKGGVMVMPPAQGKIADAPAPQANAIFKTEPIKMIGTPAPNMEYAMKMAPQVDSAKGFTEPMKMGLSPAQMEPMKMGPQEVGMKMGLAPGQMQGKIAEVKSFGPAQDFAKAFEKKM